MNINDESNSSKLATLGEISISDHEAHWNCILFTLLCCLFKSFRDWSDFCKNTFDFGSMLSLFFIRCFVHVKDEDIMKWKDIMN